MEYIENLRKELHESLETGDCDNSLKISQKLDKLIFRYMEKQLTANKKPV